MSQQESTADFILRQRWMGELPPELRALVLATSFERSVEAGEYIAHVGEPCLHWYGLRRGLLQMYVLASDGSETTLYCQREGEWAGDGSLLKNEPRRYDLRALTPSQVVFVPASTFESLRSTSLEFNRHLCEIMNERMGEFVTMLAAARLFGPEMRVARGLLMLADRRSGSPQDLSIPQHELALICGLSRQRVNTAISELRRLELVRETQRGFLAVDIPRLRDYLLESAPDNATSDGAPSRSLSASKASRSPPQNSSS